MCNPCGIKEIFHCLLMTVPLADHLVPHWPHVAPEDMCGHLQPVAQFADTHGVYIKSSRTNVRTPTLSCLYEVHTSAGWWQWLNGTETNWVASFSGFERMAWRGSIISLSLWSINEDRFLKEDTRFSQGLVQGILGGGGNSEWSIQVYRFL